MRSSGRVALILCSLLAPVVAFGSAGPCRVTVRVTNNYGDRVDARYVRLTNEGALTVVEQDKPYQMKCGLYTLEVGVRGFRPVTTQADIELVEQVVPVATQFLDPADTVAPECAVLGKVSAQAGVATVRLLQLFGTYLVDVPVSPEDTFPFMHLPCGTYLLIAISRSQCLGTERVTATVAGTRVDLKTPAGACNQ